jgi:hypothetical protein
MNVAAIIALIFAVVDFLFLIWIDADLNATKRLLDTARRELHEHVCDDINDKWPAYWPMRLRNALVDLGAAIRRLWVW